MLIHCVPALTATDRLSELTREYTSPQTAQGRLERDIKRFERRGTTARNKVDRELKKTRTRVERELRRRGTRVQRVVDGSRNRVGRQGKAAQNQVSAQVDLVSARVDDAVTTGQKVVSQASDRVAGTIA